MVNKRLSANFFIKIDRDAQKPLQVGIYIHDAWPYSVV